MTHSDPSRMPQSLMSKVWFLLMLAFIGSTSTLVFFISSFGAAYSKDPRSTLTGGSESDAFLFAVLNAAFWIFVFYSARKSKSLKYVLYALIILFFGSVTVFVGRIVWLAQDTNLGAAIAPAQIQEEFTHSMELELAGGKTLALKIVGDQGLTTMKSKVMPGKALFDISKSGSTFLIYIGDWPSSNPAAPKGVAEANYIPVVQVDELIKTEDDARKYLKARNTLIADSDIYVFKNGNGLSIAKATFYPADSAPYNAILVYSDPPVFFPEAQWIPDESLEIK